MRYNSFGGIFWAMALVAVGAFGAVSPDAANLTMLSMPAKSASGWEMALGAGVGNIRGKIGWGLSAGIYHSVEMPIRTAMGIDVGINQWEFETGSDPFRSISAPTTGGAASAIQLLPTLLFQFPLPGLYGLYSQLGLSMGPTVYLSRGKARMGGHLVHESMILGTVFLRPGVFLEVSRNLGLGLETRVGVMGPEWVVLPQLNVNWNL